MVNQLFVGNFHQHVQREFGALLGGPAVVHLGGVAADHYKGLASSLATRLVPFYKESYEPTEFLFGHIPVRNLALPQLFFQFPVLDVKGDNIPGVAQFAAVLRAPIPETYITPLVGFSHRFLPLSAFPTEDVRPKDVFNNKVGWTPLLEALNNDKIALKAADPTWVGATIGNFKVSIDVGRLVGLNQLTPYKGHTVLTMQRVPSSKSKPNRPVFEFKRNHDDFLAIARHIPAYAQRREDVGQLVVSRSNAAMMDLVFKQIDAASAAPPAPPPAA
jgi:hypothetical protein